MSSRTIAEPIKPVAPVRKTRIFISSYAFVNSADRDDGDEALTPPGSRVETFAVINLHSRAELGRLSISINSCNQSSAERSACSDPNNWVTALKNADNSRSAIVMRSAQPELEFVDGS